MEHTNTITERSRSQVPLLVNAIGATLAPDDAPPMSTAAVDRIIADMLREDTTGEGE